MRRLFCILLLFMFVGAQSAQADWRWPDPKFKPRVYDKDCVTKRCFKATKKKAKQRHRIKVRIYHRNRRREWKLWTKRYIPKCTWYGESGYGPKYSRKRYRMPNSQGSGAYGKFQFMPSTYFSVAKYRDWSPLDQEIAARREYWKHGIWPWTNCW